MSNVLRCIRHRLAVNTCADALNNQKNICLKVVFKKVVKPLTASVEGKVVNNGNAFSFPRNPSRNETCLKGQAVASFRLQQSIRLFSDGQITNQITSTHHKSFAKVI